METIRQFTDLEAWKTNHEVVLIIYKITKSFPADEKFGIIDQLRRAASSVTANIAEGFGRFHFQDKIRFYYQARGSNSEVLNFLILAKDLNILKNEDFKHISGIVLQGGRVLNGLIRATEKQVIK
jgi:four helix bundle protein